MASKGGKSKPDNDTRARRQKTLEPPKEPRRPKTHWDHVLEEMVWLSKDFESERKWKLMQAKKVALRASKGMLDQATREEKKLKEEEQRLRKVALNISKDVRKFWMKIEKLVLYKHQLVLDEKKKKALDKQLEFLLGQTERYSKMLAINLVDCKPDQNDPSKEQLAIESKSKEERVEEDPPEVNVAAGSESGTVDIDEDYDVNSGDEPEDNEDTIEEDEKHITEQERQEELEALQNEVDLPLEELLGRYTAGRVSRETSPKKDKNETHMTSKVQVQREEEKNNLLAANESEGNPSVRRSSDSNGDLTKLKAFFHELDSTPSGDSRCVYGKSGKEEHPYDFNDEQEDVDFAVTPEEEKDDEATLSEEEELAKADEKDPVDEIAILQKESEIPIEELLARYKKDIDDKEVSEDDSGYASALSEDLEDSHGTKLLVDSDDENVESRACKPNLQPCSEKHEGGSNETTEENDKDGGGKIADAAAAARSAQPTGFTYLTTKVRTKLPFLLKHSLREYQHIGLDWLVSMYEKRLNGILADEMGLGKTIMTIALLAHLACEKGIWGPHLIVVPTSVMLNWETEFLKWCPAFKILTYFGSSKERKLKRQGWMKQNSFHVCITTYRLVIQDSKIFKRKKWKYLILDEAHLIKNWKSQRWQTLLNFNSKRRILLTGTPLQNDLMELWSLMHFLMPHVFQSHQEFKDWFCNPIAGMVEGQEKVNKEVIDRLHNVLRPFILRRLKRDVEKQLPMKHEHVVFCRLSKRQRNLYEDFIASSETQATLASGNFFGMINIIMQLRKVCNHPDLFEGRPIVSSYDMVGIDMRLSSTICSMLSEGPFSKVDLEGLGFLFTHLDFSMTSWEWDEIKALSTPSSLIKQLGDNPETTCLGSRNSKKLQGTNIFEEIRKAILEERFKEAKERAASIAWWNSLRCRRKPTYPLSLRDLVTMRRPLDDINHHKADRSSYMYSSRLADIVLSPVERFQKMIDLVEAFIFSIPAARAPAPVCWCSSSDTRVFLQPEYKEKSSELLLPLLSPIRPAIVRRQVYFPDRRLIQFDCGKLQELAVLLRKLKSEGHRALIFTQMTKMLDILEAFINLYGYTYMRLDGSTQPEERQTLMQRFNTNPKIFLFILSTRSGGVGINLVGADTVIFYDSDWNPAMDQQAQDRCHRIGQTREVHIYRLISESTIEENILKKANQKRALDDLVIQSGGYNTEFFKKLDPLELFSGHKALTVKDNDKHKANSCGNEVSLSNADVEAALKRIEDEADYMALKKVEQEEAVDNQEFTEEPVDKPEDDELGNEDDLKADEPIHQGDTVATSSNEESSMLKSYADTKEERALITLSSQEEEADMLDDVKQMAAAAAAAGQAISSFENQLRPIDRYAIRFLELWDPVIDETAMETEAGFEEREWELDQIEKYKEEMEAEIDDGEEPLVYEKWDADFATEAYRQQVEALAQHQLMEDLENEAKEREAADEADMDSTQNELACAPRPKKKKKPKKAKFKSLKKGSLASESKAAKPVEKLEAFTDDDNDDDGGADYESSSDSDMVSPHVLMNRKRKKGELVVDTEEEKTLKKKSKKPKKSLPGLGDSDVKYNQSSELRDESVLTKPSENMVVDSEVKPTSRRTMGKISISSMPIKRVVMIKPEKLKKGNLWSRDCVPSPDNWLPQEDAILCAMVHEYGPNWGFVSETLYGMTAGGTYRGRYRHPAYCCERYRELIQRHILFAPDGAVNEKNLNAGSGKALLKVTEENIRALLNIAAERSDTEMLLQKHFTCLLSSVWRTSAHTDGNRNRSSCSGLLFKGKFIGSVDHTRDLVREPLQRIKIPSSSLKIVESVLQNASSSSQPDGNVSCSGWPKDQSVSKEKLDLTLEFHRATDDTAIAFPSVVNLSIGGPDSLQFANDAPVTDRLKASWSVAENRFRAAANACVEGVLGWALSTFPANDPKSRSSTKVQSLGKHKLPTSDSAKPSRAKSRKVSAGPSDSNLLNERRHSSIPCVMPNDPNLKFDFTPAATEEVSPGGDLHDNASAFSSENGVLPEITWSESMMHCYDPEFIRGLDDVSLSLKFTDIG